MGGIDKKDRSLLCPSLFPSWVQLVFFKFLLCLNVSFC